MSLFPILSRNVQLTRPLRLSSWRKVAIGTWRRPGDPSVYGILEVEAAPALRYIDKLRKETGQKITVTHFVGRVFAETLKRHPEINSVLRFGRIYPRKNVDIFFQVASDEAGEDLSGMTVRQADHKSVVEIAREMNERVQAIKTRRDNTFKQVKRNMGAMPGFITGLVLDLISFITYTLNFWSPLIGSPKDPFGSAMITNIGSLGLDLAFAPLVPYSKIPLLIAIGTVKDTAVARGGKVEVAPMIKLCATFDHRLIDGVHAAMMSRTVLAIFADPERELGPTIR